MRFLQHSKASGNLVTDYGWAQFAIWHLHPEFHLAFDGRYRTVYPESVERAYVELYTGNTESGLLENPETDVLLISSKHVDLLTRLDDMPDWKRVYDDDQSAIFVRGDHQGGLQDSEKMGKAPNWEVFPSGSARSPVLSARLGHRDSVLAQSRP